MIPTVDRRTFLAGIAPVLTTRTGLTEDTWQDQTALIGEALGEEDAASAAVADIEARIEQVRADHPEWAGRTFLSAFAFEPGAVRVGAGDAFGPRFLESLGLTLAPTVADPPSPDVAFEQLGLLDADVLLMTYSTPDLRAALEGAPLFASLPVVADGRVIDVDVALSTALAVPSVLRVEYLLNELVPEIEVRLA